MKAFVLHSGGIDSSTCLYKAIEDCGQENVLGISLFYGQRHKKEIEHAADICQIAGVRHGTLKTAEMPESMLTNPEKEIPRVSYGDLPEGKSPTYVPFRNGQLLSQVAGVAVASLEPGEKGIVYFGAHAEDAANWAYADCTPEFIGAMANAIFVGTYSQVRLATPLEWLTKPEIITLGSRLGVPWEHTWSCYKGERLHCGTCPTCRSRREGFYIAGLKDPTEYEVTPARYLDPNKIPF